MDTNLPKITADVEAEADQAGVQIEAQVTAPEGGGTVDVDTQKSPHSISING